LQYHGNHPVRRSGVAVISLEGRRGMEKKLEVEVQELETCGEEPKILEEIQVEELAIDGICGVY